MLQTHDLAGGQEQEGEQEEAEVMVARLAVKTANSHCSLEVSPSVLKTGYI